MGVVEGRRWMESLECGGDYVNQGLKRVRLPRGQVRDIIWLLSVSESRRTCAGRHDIVFAGTTAPTNWIKHIQLRTASLTSATAIVCIYIAVTSMAGVRAHIRVLVVCQLACAATESKANTLFGRRSKGPVYAE